MCFCGGAKWKREVINDHKFDYVDIDEFYNPSCWMRIKYMGVFALVFKSVLVYLADLWTLSLLITDKFRTIATPLISLSISRWIFLASIIASYIILLWDMKKARKIIRSRDIAYAFTSIIASRYYTVKSYRYYCLFQKIENSRKWKDKMAFFIFFRLKGWKRVLFAEAPRQIINFTILLKYFQLNFNSFDSFTRSSSKIRFDFNSKKTENFTVTLMVFTFTIFLLTASAILVAALAYIPLLCEIQGNLKEYCCHKIDKRIAQILLRKTRKRIARQKEAVEGMGNVGSADVKADRHNRTVAVRPLPQPTLPKLDDTTTLVPTEPDSDTAIRSQQRLYSIVSHSTEATTLSGTTLSSVHHLNRQQSRSAHRDRLHQPTPRFGNLPPLPAHPLPHYMRYEDPLPPPYNMNRNPYFSGPGPGVGRQ